MGLVVVFYVISGYVIVWLLFGFGLGFSRSREDVLCFFIFFSLGFVVVFSRGVCGF